MRELIYMDNAATTPVCEEALEAMMPYLTSDYGNPSSLHPAGQKAKKVLSEGRRTISSIIGCKPGEIYFTGGGSESDSWAIIGMAEAYRDKGRHIITSEIEHHAVLNSCRYLEQRGFEITYLKPDEEGFISPEDLEEEIREDTILISIMTANNEVGTIQPVYEIGRIAKGHGVPFHTDAVQAFCHMKIDVNECNISLLSASSHKICGPKGTGFLYIRNGIKPAPIIHGGMQERGIRGGTENTAGIAGFVRACEAASERMEETSAYISELRNHMVSEITERIPMTVLNGSASERLAGNINICFRYVDSESLLMRLAESGICCSAGSACDSGSVSPSHVLLAMGISYEDAFGSIRFSLSERNTADEVDKVIDKLTESVEELRKLSPGYMGT